MAVDVSDPQRVVLVSSGVPGPGEQPVIRRRFEGAEVEEVVAGGLDVLVEDDAGVGVVGAVGPAITSTVSNARMKS